MNHSDSDTEGNEILKYNLHCVTDNQDLSSAFKSLSRVLDITSLTNFEAFADDISNFREDTTKETLAVAMDPNFVPLNTKENIISSPFPNAQLSISKLNDVNKFKENDFILVLNNFKNDKNYLKIPQDDYKILIIKEIFIGLKTLNKFDFPYSNKSKYPDFETGEEFLKVMTLNPMEIPNYYLTMRMNANVINNMTLSNEKRCEKIIELNNLPLVIHWKDTLISDIHGYYNKKIIGTNSILVQVVPTKKGGIIYLLLGNHELSDIQSSYFYISKDDYDAFGVLSKAPSYDELYNDYISKGKSHVLFTDSLFDYVNGPLWTRIFAEGSEEEACNELEKVLKITNFKNIVILILIDIGLSHYIGNYFGYVEILNNKKEIWARYDN
ncbi:Metallo-dependent phosphatase-like protein [Neocallimastix lanati (nom. inval.)]|nr:Metallo-dependent phosphatase-like protein [Neocallimastix sp. JGI-2020a]